MMATMTTSAPIATVTTGRARAGPRRSRDHVRENRFASRARDAGVCR